jgi:hypothetical protein
MTDPISNEPVVRVLMLIAEGTVFLIALLLALGLIKAFRIWRETSRNEHKFQVMHQAIAKMRAHEAHKQQLFDIREQQPTWPELRKAYKEYTEETE